MTNEQRIELARIDAELATIEAIPYDECPADLLARHLVLCAMRAEIEPPAFCALISR